MAIEADVSKASGVKALVDETVRQLGAIDILINNAGSLIKRLTLREITDEHLDAVYALNVKSAVLAAQAVSASMIERKRGVIVNVVSIAGHNGGGPGAGAYASAKADLTCYTKSMAKELAPHGVRVNAVAPGVIATPFHDAFSTPEMLETFVSTIPLGRLGTPEECAAVIAFLASPAASYVARRDDRDQRGAVDAVITEGFYGSGVLRVRRVLVLQVRRFEGFIARAASPTRACGTEPVEPSHP